jgi:SecD/SecF fusion protein
LGPNVVQIETSELAPEDVGKLQASLESDYGIPPDGFDNQSIGPTFGEQVARSAFYAIFFSLLVICAYVAFRFEPKYAVPVVIALFHDILITAGVYSLSEREVTSGTVAAFLTILGYSLYDTVIVFDRIRENVPRLPRAAFSQIVNRSMSEVLTRSLITGLSTVFLVGVLLVFGGATLKDFAFAMMVGIASGTYSSIFIASPVLTAWKGREPAYRRRRQRIVEQMGYLPAFPEENVIARVEGGPEAGEEPVVEPSPAAAGTTADSTEKATSGLAAGEGAPPATPSKPPPAQQRKAPEPSRSQPTPPKPPAQSAADGEGDGAGEKPELSEASAAAMQRVQQRRQKKRGRRKRKHGRPR